MSEYFEHIDAYFQKQLSESEREKFEQRCITDEEFANDVALYISSRAAIHDMLLEQKKTEWSQLDIKQGKEPSETTGTIVKRINYRKWIPYAAAACLILAVILFSLPSTDSPQKLANNYVSQKLNSISQTMDGSTDSLQLGIAAYNKHDYESAMRLFQQVYDSHPSSSSALRYLGQTYLVTGNFNRAITIFEELAQKKDYSNPGLFLKAIALMQRNQGDDKQVARSLLQIVVNEQLDGRKEAEKWLENWPDK